MKTGKKLMNLIRKVYTFLTKILLILIITYLMFICVFYILRNNPSWYKNNQFFVNFFRDNYQKTRSIIQFNEECSKYDPELFYTMKEGVCVHKQLEFSVKYQINHIGLRDVDDISGTKIITLGDSFTAGFGVEQDKTFASLIEKKTKMKTLNAGMSSYGTAREAMMLDRLLKTGKLSDLKYIVLQYCSNDINENKSYIQNKFNLKVSNEEAYNSLLNYTKSLSDIKKKLFYNIFMPKFGYKFVISPEPDLPQDLYAGDAEHDIFLQIVQKKIINNPLLPRNAKIIIFNLESYLNNTDFIKKIGKLLKNKK